MKKFLKQNQLEQKCFSISKGLKYLFFSLAVLFFLTFTLYSNHHGMSDNGKGEQYKNSANLKVIKSLYTDVFSAPLDTTEKQVRAVVADSWVSTPTPVGGDGHEGLVKTLEIFGGVMPDLKLVIQEILQDGNRYIVRSIMTGTPIAPFLGVAPPTGKSFEIMTIDIHTIEKGKIVRSYHIEGWLQAIRQLRADQ